MMNQVINLAYYNESDWERLIAFADDRDGMHDTWQEWHESFLNTKNRFISEGYEVREIIVDLDELLRYCHIKGIKNDGKARSSFVADK